MKKFLVLLVAIAMVPALSFAQVKGGDIYGTAVLDDGSAVPGVLVTITGDKIGTLTTVTTDQGNFRFLSLPPGGYELKFGMEGFKTVIRKDIEVSLGKSVTVNIVMETTTLQEEVIVSGRVGIVDTRKASVGIEVTKEMVDTIPTARNPWSVLSMTPGIVMEKADVGGNESGQQTIFMAAGGDSMDTTWNVDGANITDPSAIGAAPAYLNSNSYDALQVSMGANDISAQTGGIQLNFVTKRAGNKTSGDFHLYVEDAAWEFTSGHDLKDNMEVIPGVDRLYQYGVDIGGPIMKDKIWWFGSWAVQDIHKRTAADIEDATWLVSGYGKLNFQFGNTSGEFHLSYDAKLKWGRTWMSPSQQDANSLWDQTGPGYVYYGGLSHIIGNLMLNVKAIYTDGGFALTPRGSVLADSGFEEGEEFKVIDGWSRTEGSAWHYWTNRDTLNLSVDGNYFLEGKLGGDHEIKFGVDYYTATTTSQQTVSNQRISMVYRYDPSLNFLQMWPNYSLDVGFTRISAYIQDNITFGKFTVSFGLRYDRESGKVNPFTQPGIYWHEPGSPHHGEQIFSDVIFDINPSGFKVPAAWKLFSPRLAVTYDIGGDGKTVLKLSAGRYMSQSGNQLASAYVPYRYGYCEWTDANLDEIPQFNEVGSLTWIDYFAGVDAATGLNRVEYDSGYNTPYLDELTLSLEKAITDDLAVGVTGFYRKKHNLAVFPDSRGEFNYWYKGLMPDGSVESNNYEYIGTTTIGGTEVPTYERIDDPVGYYYTNLENSYTQYLGLQLKITKKLSNHWMMNASATIADWKWKLDEADFDGDLNNFEFFNNGDVAESTDGSGTKDIWVNSRWMFKISGIYQLPYGINLTGFFQAREGNPQPKRRNVGLNQGTVRMYMEGEKSGDERVPAFWMLNLGLEKTFKLSDTASATLVVDWYNVTNNQITLKENLTIGEDPPGAPEEVIWLTPGLFQFGVRVSF